MSAAARRTLLAAGLLAAALGLLASLSPATSSAARPFDFGFADDRFGDNLYTNSDPAVRAKWFGRAADVGSRFARINVYWSQVAPDEPADPRDPRDPAYDWDEIDDAVRGADDAGLEAILLPLNAPRWAEGSGRPGGIRTGVWKPSPSAVEDFSRALATRYSGNLSDGGKLPRVRYYEAWNEPNLDNYIEPQWNGRNPASPEVYRPILNAVYDGVKAIQPSALVITGGTSPFGDLPGGKKVAPLLFWRQVFCLNNKLKRQGNACSGSERPRFDIFGHNAINEPGDKPQQEALFRDDATPSDMKDLKKILRAAEKRGTVQGRGHGLWSTETWYESDPPEKAKGKALPLKQQAQAMVDSMYILWKAGADNVIFLQLRDSVYDPKTPALVGFQSGIYFLNEKPKPAVRALRFPFSVDVKRRAKKIKRKGHVVRTKPAKAVLWGIAPTSGRVKVQEKRHGFKTIAKQRVKAGDVFKLKSKLRGKKRSRLRARIGSQKSLTVKAKT